MSDRPVMLGTGTILKAAMRATDQELDVPVNAYVPEEAAFLSAATLPSNVDRTVHPELAVAVLESISIP